jgi:hypothetical protein
VAGSLGSLPDGFVLDLARLSLQDSGYEVTLASIPDFKDPLLVANDAYSTIGIISANEWSDVAGVLDALQLNFANWAIDHVGSEKRWDLYLVFLVSSEIKGSELTPVERFVSDIRYVRKIVRGAVYATRESVEMALAPFLPVSPATQHSYGEPLEELERDLRVQGQDPALISSAIESFRRTGVVELP